jgi:cytochrome P450
MRGMLDRQRAQLDAGECTEENLLTALIQAQSQEDEKEGRTLNYEEVMGNMFIMLFAGHETTANTLHYSLLLLAQHPDIQQILLNEIDTIYQEAAQQGRRELEYELDFNRARWTFAIMSETLRVYTPTGMTNKWTATDQPIAFEGSTYVIPQGTRISINGTGVHANPKVWGDNANEWQPSRWIIHDGDGDAPLVTPLPSRTPSPMGCRSFGQYEKDASGPSTPNSPFLTPFAAQQQRLAVPSPPGSRRSSSPTISATTSSQGILKPAKGTFLPFSEGSRACSGKKFATVEFVAVLFTLLREHRLELEDGWSAERVKQVLSGRKPGGITLQPPESIPLRFVRR